jgi:hypothetical protein
MLKKATFRFERSSGETIRCSFISKYEVIASATIKGIFCSNRVKRPRRPKNIIP